MSDGNTTPLGPVQESEMSHIRQIFDRAANAIVAASELAKVVDDLKVQVEALRGEVEKVRRENGWLDGQLANVREARDKALAEATQVRSELVEANHRAETAEAKNESQSRQIQALQDQLAKAQGERDDYGMRHMEASDALDKANGKLAKLREAMGIEDSPKPTPVPEATNVVDYKPVESGASEVEAPNYEPAARNVNEPWRSW